MSLPKMEPITNLTYDQNVLNQHHIHNKHQMFEVTCKVHRSSEKEQLLSASAIWALSPYTKPHTAALRKLMIARTVLFPTAVAFKQPTLLKELYKSMYPSHNLRLTFNFFIRLNSKRYKL